MISIGMSHIEFLFRKVSSERKDPSNVIGISKDLGGLFIHGEWKSKMRGKKQPNDYSKTCHIKFVVNALH